jgi:ribosomal protein S18 acetylase RimI-like enzyme
MALPTPLEIERAGLKGWPGVEVEWDRSWVSRASGGHTQRANSTQCFDPSDDDDVGRRVEASRRWFEARGIRPTFRVNLLSGPNLLAELDSKGWISVDHSMLIAMPLDELASDDHGEVLAVDDPVFLKAQTDLKHWDDVTLRKFQAIAAMFDVPAGGIVLRSDDSRVVSSALMAVADGIVITGNVVTDAAERGRGYGSRMMRTGLAWAYAQGARTAALNVAADNGAGQALYKSLGYRRQYDYVYRTPGPK